jgi:hypothetical protein
MYRIEKKPWGLELTFADTVPKQEMQAWLDDSKNVLKTLTPGFGVFVDLRTLKPIAADAQAVMQEGQKLFKTQGMARSVVILTGSIVTLQFKRIAKETGIYEWERYLDSSVVPTWKDKGIAWVRDKIDPDK